MAKIKASELREQNKTLNSENENWRTKVMAALEEYSNGTYPNDARRAHAIAQILSGTTLPLSVDVKVGGKITSEEQKKIDIMESALKFYESNWKEVPYTTPEEETEFDIEPTDALIDDQGEIAMKALRATTSVPFVQTIKKK
jgi:hypothetical protein